MFIYLIIIIIIIIIITIIIIIIVIIIIIIISNSERSEQIGSCKTIPSKIYLYVCLSVRPFVCLSVCLSVRLFVRPFVFYLLLHLWMDQNEIIRDRRHHPLDGYYILKTYC